MESLLAQIPKAVKISDIATLESLISQNIRKVNRKILFAAIEKDDGDLLDSLLPLLRVLVNKCFRMSQPHTSNKKLRTPLIFAAENNYIHSLKSLIKHGAIINHKIACHDAPTAIRSAIAYSNSDIIKELLEHGAEKESALVDACENKQLDIIKLLLSYATPEEMASPFYRDDLLIFTIDESHLSFPEDEEDEILETIKIVKFFLEKGADLSKKDEHGLTPLHYASVHTSPEIARLLLESGADVNCANDLGNTPLMHAAYCGLPDMVEFFLNNDASIDATNLRNETAFSLCSNISYYNTVDTQQPKFSAAVNHFVFDHIEADRKECGLLIFCEYEIRAAGFNTLNLTKRIIHHIAELPTGIALKKMTPESLSEAITKEKLILLFSKFAPTLSMRAITKRLLPLVEDDISSYVAFKYILSTAERGIYKENKNGEQTKVPCPKLTSIWGLFKTNSGLHLTIAKFLAPNGLDVLSLQEKLNARQNKKSSK